MNVYKIEEEITAAVRQNEAPTSFCFLYRNNTYSLSVLLVETGQIENDFCIIGVSAVAYWDNEAERIIREEIPYQIEKELPLPITIGYFSEEETETFDIDEEKYYETILAICDALNGNCVTDSMKAEYRKLMEFDSNKEMEALFARFFPDAMKVFQR